MALPITDVDAGDLIGQYDSRINKNIDINCYTVNLWGSEKSQIYSKSSSTNVEPGKKKLFYYFECAVNRIMIDIIKYI